ncbi:MAG: hypothetical protein ACRDLO_13250 [Solirubrobacterales bacterium]
MAEQEAMGAADELLAADPEAFVAAFADVFVGCVEPLAQAFASGHELLDVALHLACREAAEHPGAMHSSARGASARFAGPD